MSFGSLRQPQLQNALYTWYCIHGIRMQENPQAREEILLDFDGFSWSFVSPKSNLHPRTEISSLASLTAKLSTEIVNHLNVLRLVSLRTDPIIQQFS